MLTVYINVYIEEFGYDKINVVLKDMGDLEKKYNSCLNYTRNYISGNLGERAYGLYLDSIDELLNKLDNKSEVYSILGNFKKLIENRMDSKDLEKHQSLDGDIVRLFEKIDSWDKFNNFL